MCTCWSNFPGIRINPPPPRGRRVQQPTLLDVQTAWQKSSKSMGRTEKGIVGSQLAARLEPSKTLVPLLGDNQSFPGSIHMVQRQLAFWMDKRTIDASKSTNLGAQALLRSQQLSFWKVSQIFVLWRHSPRRHWCDQQWESTQGSLFRNWRSSLNANKSYPVVSWFPYDYYGMENHLHPISKFYWSKELILDWEKRSCGKMVFQRGGTFGGG